MYCYCYNDLLQRGTEFYDLLVCMSSLRKQIIELFVIKVKFQPIIPTQQLWKFDVGSVVDYNLDEKTKYHQNMKLLKNFIIWWKLGKISR